MSMIVNTNVSSLSAQRALAESASMMSKAMERLSSGDRINSAADDAAGLAIVQRMTAQINGLNMAVKNANDGIALTKSVEGALVEVVDMLQRLRELAVQSANDTNTDTDRRYIQEEVNLLIAEITRISTNTRHNGQLVLDGNFTNKYFQVGTEGGERIQVSVDSVASNKLGSYVLESIADTTTDPTLSTTHDTAIASHVEANTSFAIAGKGSSVTVAVADDDSVETIAKNINAKTGTHGVTAEAKTYAKLDFAATGTYILKLNGTSTGSFTATTSNGADAAAKINAISGTTGITAEVNSDNDVIIYNSAGKDIIVINDSAAAASDVNLTALKFDGSTAKGGTIVLEGTNADVGNTGRVVGSLQLRSPELFSVVDGSTTLFAAAPSASLSTVSNIALNTQSGANSAISVIDGAIEKVSSMRANLGAVQNRLEHTVSNLMNVSENTSDARSRIQDADFSVESANLAKAQVLQQAGTAMLAQSNARPQLVLQLLQ
jgi:flagellin